MNADVPSEFRYKAFISYSHRDKRWGDWLHRALETYRVPKRLVGNAGRDGVIESRIVPVFRDREELPTSSDLGSVISDALAQSRMLIVICSPSAAQSRWVNEEIITFKKAGGSGRILCVIVDGEPNASDKPGEEAKECFPPALRFEVDTRGELTDERSEPIAADVRPGGDGKRNALLKLVAGLLGVGFDDLKQRELQRRQQRMIVVTAVSLLLMAVTVTLAVLALISKREAVESKELAETERAVAQNLERQSMERLTQLYIRSGWREHQNEDEAGGLLFHIESLKTILSASEANENDQIAQRFARIRIGHLLRRSPELQSVLVHDELISQLQISHDKTRLLTASWDGNARVWDLKTGEPISEWFVHSARVNAAALSDDGKRVATLCDDFKVRVWDVETSKLLAATPRLQTLGSWCFFTSDGHVLAGSYGNHAVKWKIDAGVLTPLHVPDQGEYQLYPSRDGKRMVSVRESSFVIRNADTLVAIGVPTQLPDYISDVQFSADGSRFATRLRYEVRVFDSTTGKLVVGPLRHTKGINAVTFSPDGTHLLTGGRGGIVGYWNLSQPQQPVWHKQFGVESVDDCHFSPDGRWVSVSIHDIGDQRTLPSRVAVLSAADGDRRTPWLHHAEGGEFTPDGEGLITTREDGLIHLWRLPFHRDQPENLRAEGDGINHINQGEINIQSLMLADEGGDDEAYILAGTNDNTLWMWQRDQNGQWQGRERLKMPPGRLGAHFVGDLQPHPDGRRVIASCAERVFLFDPHASDHEVISLEPNADVFDVQVDPASRRMLLSSYYMSLWDLNQNKVIAPSFGSAPNGMSTLLMSGGETVISAYSEYEPNAEGFFQVWDAETGKESKPVFKIQGAVQGMLQHPDGKTVIVGVELKANQRDITFRSLGGQIQQLDWTTSQLIGEPIRDVEFIKPVAVSKDGAKLLTWSTGNEARLWDLRTSKPLTPPMQNDSVAFAKFSPDESMVLAGGGKHATVWDAHTGLMVIPSLKHTGFVRDAVISPDGKQMIVGARFVSIWPIEAATMDVAQLADHAELLADRYIDSSGALRRLNREQWMKRWKRIAK